MAAFTSTNANDGLVSGAVDGVDVVAAHLQPLTVEQERRHVEKVHGEQAIVSGREAHHGSEIKERHARTKARHTRQSGGRHGRACQGGQGQRGRVRQRQEAFTKCSPLRRP